MNSFMPKQTLDKRGRRAAEPAPEPAAPTDQAQFARGLEWGARLGLVSAVLGLALYISNLLPGRLSAQEVAAVWNLPLADFLRHTHVRTGLAWLSRLDRGDGISTAGIAVLTLSVLPGLLVVLRSYLQRRDGLYVALCAAQVLVLLLSASGLVIAGH